VYAVAVSPFDGNVVACGRTNGQWDPYVAGPPNPGQWDALMVGVDDSTGDEIWRRHYHSGTSSCTGVVISSVTNKAFFAISGSLSTSWMGIFRYSANSRSRERTGAYGTLTYSAAITLDSNDYPILVGRTHQNYAGTYYGSADVLVVKADPVTLNQVWAKQRGTSLYDSPEAVVTDSQDNVIVAGRTGGAFQSGVPVSGNTDIFIWKLDSDGNEVFRRQFSGTNSDEYTSGVDVLQNDYIVLGGYVQNGQFVASSDGNNHPFVLLTDSAGTEQWRHEFSSYSYTSSAGLRVDSDQDMLLADDTTIKFRINAAPVAVDDTYFIVAPDSNVTLAPLSNDTDANEADTVTVIAIGPAEYGVITAGDNAGEYVYVVNSNVCDVSEVFPYTISDGHEESSANIAITIDVPVDPTAPSSVPTFTAEADVSDSSKFIMTLAYSREYDRYVNVTFANSTNSRRCDFSTLDYGDWSVSVDVGACGSQAVLNISFNDLLNECGFLQDGHDRGDFMTHFVQVAEISTARTRADLRDDTTSTTTTEVPIDVKIPYTALAVFSNLDDFVFGVPVTLGLLGEARVNITDAASNTLLEYHLEAEIVTSVQYPYRLELSASDIDPAMFEPDTVSIVADTYCEITETHTTGTVCRQVWSLSAQIRSDVMCVGNVDRLDENMVNLTFAVNCSENAQVECAPGIAGVKPPVVALVSTPRLCPAVERISLLRTMDVYAYQNDVSLSEPAPTSGSASFFSDTSDTPPLTFVQERIFTIDTMLYGEVHVSVERDGATIESTTVLRVSTNKDVYLHDPDVPSTTKQDDGIVVQDDQFGATAGYTNDRSRFAIPVNANTVDNIDAEDAAEVMTIEVLVRVEFLEASNNAITGPGPAPAMYNPVLADMHRDQHLKSRHDDIVVKMQNDIPKETRDMGVSVQVRIADHLSGGSNGRDQDSDNSTSLGHRVSDALGGSVGVGLAIGAVAVTVILVFAAIRRKRRKTSCSSNGTTVNINTDSKLSLDGRILPSQLPSGSSSSDCRPIELVEHNVAAVSGDSMFGDSNAVSDHMTSAHLVGVHSAYAH
jgi:Bacterial Ig domain